MLEKIISKIRTTYEDANCHIHHKSKLSESFEVRSGVRQGCIFSPVLFLIVLEDVLREALKIHQASEIRWTMASFLQHLDNADHICLFAHKIPELSAMVKSLEVVVASASLTINCRKTKILILTRNANGLVRVGE